VLDRDARFHDRIGWGAGASPHREVHRPFKVPLYPVIPILGIVLCGYLMLSLPFVTWLRFLVWLVIGMTIYAGYSFRHSKLTA
jgi:APA family basic amino acid/polyamine antiporter